MTPIRVLIADDHALVRAGIRALVEKIEGMVVVGEADVRDLANDVLRHLVHRAVDHVVVEHAPGPSESKVGSVIAIAGPARFSGRRRTGNRRRNARAAGAS